MNTKEWFAGGATWAEQMATQIERSISPGCKHESAIEALRCVAIVRRQAAISDEKTMVYITQAIAHWKDFMLFDDAVRGEKNRAGTSEGGVNRSKKKKETAAEWQIKILPRVKRMLAAGKKDSNIAALLASDTRTQKEPARGVEVVRKFVAEVRKTERKK